MKIIILVLSAQFEPYISLEKTIRETWATEKLPGIEVFYYYGNSPNIEIIGDKIFSKHPEGLYNVGYKTLDAFELIKDFDFDYVFRTNSSSYINQKNLLKFIEDKPRDNFYSGINNDYYNIKYCSGAGYFLSKNLIKSILDNKNYWNHSLIDDVAIGELIVNKLHVPLDNQARRLDLNDQNCTFENIKDQYHIRCKYYHDNRNFDIIHMKKIFQLLNE
jgi:hypothetical protein